ncbi:MAG: antitoxin, RHH family protein [Candidatus Omnitrophota bacterium]
MSTKNPRLNVVLEAPLYRTLKHIAYREGVSLSLKARDLIRLALEYYEDAYWVKAAEQREKTFSEARALKHKKVWS